MKRLVQRLFNTLGYRLERIQPPLPGKSIFVLDYLLYLLNQARAGKVSFVQIGANDGIREDPCYAWINRFPWQGILVEPQPDLADLLRRMYEGRTSIHVEQAIISPTPGKVKLYYLRHTPQTPAWMSGIASVRKETIAQHRHKIPEFDTLLAEQTCDAITFDQLMRSRGMNTLDYLQIDAEGSDYAILKTIDVARLRPLVICYEHANLEPSDNASCRRYLSDQGYYFASWLGDTVACLPELFPVSDDRRRYLLA